MKPRSCALLALAALVVPFLLAAPETGKKLAVVVGVNEYKGDLSDLAYAENDAEEMAKELKKAGFTVTLLTTRLGKRDAGAMPTAAIIRKAILDAVKEREKADTVLIAMAGHGVQLEIADPEGKEASKTYPYFCPHDFDKSGIRFETGIGTRLINLNWLFRELEGSSAGRKMVLVDACRNMGKAVAAKRYIDAKKVTVPDGVCAMFSCAPGQFAYEAADLGGRGHGVFFHFVLEGLRGEAKNKAGDVTWGGLTEYVARQVPRGVSKYAGAGTRQTPHQVTNVVGETPVLVAGATETVPERPKADGKYVTNSIGMKLVRIPAGEFWMGSPADEKGRSKDETKHKVKIAKAFHLGVHEVTQKQFRDVMGYNPSYFSRDGKKRDADAKYLYGDPAGGKYSLDAKTGPDALPVENVSWEEAVEFCRKLSEKEAKSGRLYRLPTEAEWEYSCRGSSSSTKAFHFGDKLNGEEANCDGNSPYGTTEKGPYLKRTTKGESYKANAFGLYDMHGNVFEWCADWYGLDYYASSPASDPAGPSEGVDRVFRGGSWSDYGGRCRSASRGGDSPTARSPSVGFRVALVPSGK